MGTVLKERDYISELSLGLYIKSFAMCRGFLVSFLGYCLEEVRSLGHLVIRPSMRSITSQLTQA